MKFLFVAFFLCVLQLVDSYSIIRSNYCISSSFSQMTTRRGKDCSKVDLSSSEPSKVIAGVGDEGCQLPSPSKINTKPIFIQALSFVSVMGGVFGGVIATVAFFQLLASTFPEPIKLWMTTWPLLGVIYAAAGVAHFTILRDFRNIMPAQGSWGFWYLPGTTRPGCCMIY